MILKQALIAICAVLLVGGMGAASLDARDDSQGNESLVRVTSRVVCDRALRRCSDRFGPSVLATRKYLGDKAAERLVRDLRQGWIAFTKTIADPKVNGLPVATCGPKADPACTERIADRYCQMARYSKAEDFGISRTAEATYLIAKSRVCSAGHCHSLKDLRCAM